MCGNLGTMDPLEDTLPRTYTCPLCRWEHTTHYGIRLIQAVTQHDRVEHDIPPANLEPPC